MRDLKKKLTKEILVLLRVSERHIYMYLHCSDEQSMKQNLIGRFTKTCSDFVQSMDDFSFNFPTNY